MEPITGRDKKIGDTQRGQKIIVNQSKTILVIVSIKPFTCQSFRKNDFHAKFSGRFLLRQPLNEGVYKTKNEEEILKEPSVSHLIFVFFFSHYVG